MSNLLLPDFSVTRAVTLTQPWATLMALGAKRFETRSWRTNFRGWLAIHAAKGFPAGCQSLCQSEPFRSVLLAAGYKNTNELPRGQVICAVYLYDCVQTNTMAPQGNESAFGDYSPGRYAWLTRGVKKVWKLEAKGKLSIWDLPRALTKEDIEA